MKIRAAVSKEADSLYVIEEVDLEEPHADEMLVKVAASGYCRTDEHIRMQDMQVKLPAVLGHEGCGVVVKTGVDVKEFKAGDRVAFSYGNCGKCDQCLDGKPSLCILFEMINFGGVQADGTSRLSQNGKTLTTLFGQSSFAEYAVVNERTAVKVPDDIPLEITGPLGCGIQTGAGAVLNRLKPRPGSAIAVFGCGSVGLSAIMAAKISNCATIIGVDQVPSRLDMALELGATHVVNTTETPDAVEEIRKLTGRGADCSVDTSGSGVCIRMALNCIKRGSSAVVVGGGGDISLHVERDLMGGSKSLVGVVEGDSNPKLFIPELIEHYRAGRFPFDKLITYYDFDDINTAMSESMGGKAIKAVLRMK